MSDKDMLLMQLYALGKRLNRNMLLEFLERYDLENFAQASAGQMREFYAEHTDAVEGEK